jgi:lipoprotein signal peptidase
MLPYQTLFFVIITAVVVVFIIFYYRTLTEDHFWLRLGLALQLGGAIGNLIDRLRGGYVIDFINFTVWPPVFNIADSAISSWDCHFYYRLLAGSRAEKRGELIRCILNLFVSAAWLFTLTG